MSEYVSHTIFAEDCRLLTCAFRLGPEGLAQAAATAEGTQAMRLGARASRGDRHSVALAEALRAEGRKADPTEICFLAGWRCHNCIDRQFKPLYRLIDVGYLLTPELDGPSNVSISQDVFLLREIAPTGLFPDGLVGSAGDDRLARVLGATWFDDYLALGISENPSVADAIGKREKPYVDLSRYDAIAAREADELKEEVASWRLYDPSGPLEQLLAGLRRNAEPQVKLDAALSDLKRQSHYARAAARFAEEIRVLKAFFEGRMDAGALHRAIDADTPHMDEEMSRAIREPAPVRQAIIEDWHREGGL
jgi:hypothetical protein